MARVLLIDDEPIYYKMIVHALKPHGYEVEYARTGMDYVASSKHMICSQLVDFVYMQSGIHLFNDGRWPGYVTPADLASLLGK